MILVTKWFGTFVCEEGAVKRSSLFPKNPDQIATRLEKVSKGELLDEERVLAPSTDKVADRRMRELGKVVRFDSSFIRPEDYGFSLDMFRDATIALAKHAVKSSVGSDVHLGQAVRAYDDLVFTTNILSERLHEWYGFHFPELEVVTGPESYARAIADYGPRAEVLSALNLRLESIGSEIEPEDLDSVRLLAYVLKESLSVRGKIEKYVDKRMKDVAPNVSTLAGPVVGARLIMQAGNLKRLAGMPSSTIQLLGAEKAMFRHLRKGSRPPKHGILFTHPLVRNAPPWQRGAIARALAAKLCLAARADAYSHSDISGILKEQLDKRIAEIRKQHAGPPKRASGKGRQRGR